MPTPSCGIGCDRPGGQTREAICRHAARELLGHLRDLGFRAYLDQGALYLADTTGWRRDVFRFISPTLVFEVLNAGLDDDLALLDCQAGVRYAARRPRKIAAISALSTPRSRPWQAEVPIPPRVNDDDAGRAPRQALCRSRLIQRLHVILAPLPQRDARTTLCSCIALGPLTQTEQPRSSPSFQGTARAEPATARRAKLTPR